MADVTRNVFRGTHVRFLPGMALAGVLCFLAASISSAGAIGGGGLFVPVLKVVGGLDLQTASGFSAFMLNGGSVANVVCSLFVKSPRLGNRCPIDYNIALLSEPCMGVIGNLVLPEWLITALFAVFVGWTAFVTCRSGIWLWKIESEEGKGIARLGKGNEDGNGIEDGKEPLLLDLEMQSREGCEGDKFPWTRVGVLIVVWFSFFLVYLLRGNQYGQDSSGSGPTNRLVFQAMALASGLLSGIFGIGGSMLISPLLLQVRFPPETTMSAIQYVLLGMDGIEIPLAFSLTCSVSSNIGIVMVQRATEKFGRASLIVFSVSVVMALSMILITGYGSINVWNDYVSGRYMGFKSPC